jgi:hypothetical protein
LLKRFCFLKNNILLSGVSVRREEIYDGERG